MANEIAKAYVQIIPSMKGVKGSLEEQLGGAGDEAGKKAGEKAGGGFLSKMGGAIAKGAAVVGTAAATAAAAIVKSAVSNFADYEQLVGGVETLFKDSSDIVQQYAANAFQTAGLSANQYMETVTSFSASLLQSLDGDTEAAAKAADMAITDMSDNANKMGTSMESIQNAYQGFAKQNYTMLDNLKLGYGGTKEEMERLLADAEEISGIKYDISNLNDVYSAIHVVQTELGITGTTAKEASTTISGSAASMKAAWQNMLTGIADGNADFSGLIDNLVSSVSTFGKNILPVIQTALAGVGKLIAQLAPAIVAELPKLVSSVLPGLVEAANGIVSALAGTLPTLLPMLITAVADFIVGSAPSLVSAVFGIVTSLTEALPDILSSVLTAITELLPELIQSIVDFVITEIPLLMDAAHQFFGALIEALPDIINTLVSMLPEMLTTVVNTVLDTIVAHLPDMINAGVTFFVALIEDLPNIIQTIINALPEIITSIVNTLIDSVPQLIAAGVTLFVSIIANLPTIIAKLISAVPTIVASIVKAFKEKISEFKGIGKNIVDGVWNGIKNAAATFTANVKNFFKNIVSSVKSALGIKSPSRIFRDEVGKMMAAGIGVGFSDEMENVRRDVLNEVDGLTGNVGTISAGFEASVNTMPIASADTGITGVAQRIIDAINNRETSVRVFLDSREIRAGQERLSRAMG